jgi:hypothetical protein
MTDTLDRTETRETLWVTDAEIIRRLGAPDKIARAAIRALDASPTGFPRKQKLWGDRRYWPAVRAFLDKQNGLTVASPPTAPRGRS